MNGPSGMPDLALQRPPGPRDVLRESEVARTKGWSAELWSWAGARGLESGPDALLSRRGGGGTLHVMSIEELQSAVAQFPAEELDRFSQWFEEFLAEQWDRRIEADILAGRLDAAGRRADEDFEAGHCTPLCR